MSALKAQLRREASIAKSARVLQVRGMFDRAAAANKSVREWDVELALPDEWSIGVIHGPSMAGKSVVGRWLAEQIGGLFVTDRDAEGNRCDLFAWPAGRSIIDGFPESLGIAEITGLLSSVGFSSPPDWDKPFAALSNGGQFRVTVARAIAEAMADGATKPVVMDEFTSVVDRQVAKIGSAAVAKAVRRAKLKFVAVSLKIADFCPNAEMIP